MALSGKKLVKSRLLLLEHDRHVIDELRDMLVSGGFECEVALTPETAEEILAERYMDAVVADAKVIPAPPGGVRGLIQRLKAVAPLTKVVVFNGVTSKATQRKMRRLGAEGYLGRRSDLKAVVRSVQRILGQEP